MTIRSWTFQNETRLKEQVESEKYASKSEVMNGQIRKAPQTRYSRDKLISAEQGGFSDLTCDEILAKARDTMDGEAEL